MLASPRIEAAFHAVAREHFLPETFAEGGLEAVYRDEAIATKRNAQGLPISSSSQPAIMAQMLELLAVQPGDRVLEIGAGTGYNAALLSHLAGPSGRVTSIDIDAEIARSARRAVREAGAQVTVVAGDGRVGHGARAPYDRIIVTASAGELPRAWLEQLADAGRLVVPLRLDPERGAVQVIPAFERRGAALRSVGMTWGGFMPLHGGDGGWQPPSAMLSAGLTVGGRHTALASLTGPGLAQLRQPSANALLVALLGSPAAPRRRGLTGLSGRQPPSLLLYLLLTVSAGRRLSLDHPGRWGIGLVDRRSQSAAIVSLRSPWTESGGTLRTRARWRLDTYGADAAGIELDHLLARWHELERTGHTTLCITARGRGHTLRLRFTWAASDE